MFHPMHLHSMCLEVTSKYQSILHVANDPAAIEKQIVEEPVIHFVASKRPS